LTTSSSSSDDNEEDEVALLTQVLDSENDEEEKTTASSSSSSASLLPYPLQPPISSISEFKTTPSVHVGYAITWFGLSGAGLYMTKKLITKGRY
jgi:cytochrome oxidase assembly protein ShyY1